MIDLPEAIRGFVPRAGVTPLKHRSVGILASVCLVLAGAAMAPARPWAASRPSAGSEKGHAYYLYSLAQQAQLERNYVDALKYLQEAARADGSAELRVELADLYATLNQYGEAEEQVRSALKQEPGNVEGRRLLSQILASRSPAGEAKEERLQEAETILRGLLEEGKADDDTVLALADLQMDRGEGDAARQTLEDYRSSHGASTSVDMELARICQLEGETERAVGLLREVLEREKGNREARNALGSLLEDAGRYEEAAQVFTGLVEQSPGNPYGHYRLAGVLLSLGRYREAQEHLKSALQADPRNVRVLLALGQSYEGTHETALAEGAYRKVLEQDPSSVEGRFFLARVHQARGEDDEALALYREILLENGARESHQQKAFYVLAATQVGVIRLLQKNYPAALESLGQAYLSSEKPGDGLYALLARTHLEAGQFDEARKILSEGREKYPEDRGLSALEGEILLRTGRREEAHRLFASTLGGSGGDEAAYLEVIEACLRAEDFQEAAGWAREAVQKHPDSRDLAFQEAAVLERLGRFREAEKKFKALIQKRPEDAEALNYLGYMLADRGVKLREALEMLEKAVGREPDNSAYLDSLGWVHYRLGHYQEAETYLERATRDSRPDPTILQHLGDVYTRRGKKAEALEAYRKSLALDPDNPEEIRRKIQKLGADPDAP